jgi:hypothetical protein
LFNCISHRPYRRPLNPIRARSRNFSVHESRREQQRANWSRMKRTTNCAEEQSTDNGGEDTCCFGRIEANECSKECVLVYLEGCWPLLSSHRAPHHDDMLLDVTSSASALLATCHCQTVESHQPAHIARCSWSMPSWQISRAPQRKPSATRRRLAVTDPRTRTAPGASCHSQAAVPALLAADDGHASESLASSRVSRPRGHG